MKEKTDWKSEPLWSEAIKRFRKARRIAVLTGAGISAESGIPTFRDKQTGFWGRFSVQEMATPNAFRKDKSLVWGWYAWRRKLVALARPNPGHIALAELANFYDHSALVTQNVDDLHERAGSDPVIHLHGQLNQNRCFACNEPHELLKDDIDEINCVDLTLAENASPPKLVPPSCHRCGGYLRPDVIWFGESLSEKAWALAASAVSCCDLILCIGTSGLVYPAARLPEIGKRNGATIIQVNPNETDLDDIAHINLRGSAGEVLPTIVAAISGQ